MFQNYLITALRNFVRHKLYSFINIAGLMVGLTCAIFIILFLRYQLSYDRWIPDSGGLYRVEVTAHNPGQAPLNFAGVSFPMPHAMQQQLPEIKAATVLTPENMTVIVGDRQFPENVDVVDPNFLDVVKLPLAAGDPAAALRRPDGAVISESAAKKYFGNADPMGKTLTVTGKPWYGSDQTRQENLVVKGVMRDLPANSQLSGDILLPNNSKADLMPDVEKQTWGNINSYGYVALQKGATVAQVMPKLYALVDRSVADVMRTMHVNLKGSVILTPTLTRFWDVHLSTDRYGGMTPAGSWATVYGFAVIGVLILLVACFNFTNLATARAMIRAREISLRKVMGARRRQLILQFLGESVLTALIALLLALSLAEMLLPLFDRFLGAPVTLSHLGDWRLILAMTAMALVAGLIGGAYPALMLSRFRPALVLRASRGGLSGSGMLRTVLVVLQFAVSIGLGIAALVVFEQVSFARDMDTGFNRDNIVIINADNLTSGTRQSLTRALAADPAISAAALSSATPFGEGMKDNLFVRFPGQAFNDSFRTITIAPGFLELYGIGLVTGRAFSEAHGADSFASDGKAHNVLINEAAARRMGVAPSAALGKTFILNDTPVTVVGVTRDFKIEGARIAPVPTVYRDIPGPRFVSVKLRPGRLGEGVAAVDRIWRSFAPSVAIERHFLDQDFDRQFQADQKQDSVFGLFVGIAIFIAAMGLFGLAAFSTERRTREIGLRKTFGARTGDIVLMLLWQFSVPVLVANLIAWPVAYFYLHNWLEGYAYRISLSPLYFVGAGAAALVIAWATVIVHAAHVARANPVHALRYE
ncbi:MAG TPA: ABC transporter permease [Rhizomicrobium sp.]|jgi:putative ABC transport system permease protein|nr:ABC transporter permease [Rhizomicrobium sp.]